MQKKLPEGSYLCQILLILEIVINPKRKSYGLKTESKGLTRLFVRNPFPIIFQKPKTEFRRPVFCEVKGDTWVQSDVEGAEIQHVKVGVEVCKQ